MGHGAGGQGSGAVPAFPLTFCEILEKSLSLLGLSFSSCATELDVLPTRLLQLGQYLGSVTFSLLRPIPT